MKILFHHRIRSKDGQFVHLEELVSAFRREGHDVVIVGPAHLERSQFGADAGAAGKLKRILPRFLYEAIEFLYSVPAFFRVLRAIRREWPDFVYERYNLFFPSGIWAARMLRRPLILEINAPLFEERSLFGGVSLKWLAAWSEAYVWRRADHVLPVTEQLAQRVVRAGVERDRLTVVHNGIDESHFAVPAEPAAIRNRLGLSRRCVLGFVGFARPWHGLDQVIRHVAARPADDLHLLLVGDGPVRHDLERLAAELGVSDRLTVTGIVGRDTVASYIHSFDVALQPAVVEYASPLKLFEYMICGKAIVAPATPNIREILEDGVHALLFDTGQPASLTDALDRLCRSRELRSELGDAARRRITERGLTWTANARRVVEIARRECARTAGEPVR